MCDSDAKRAFNWALGAADMPEVYLKDIDLYCIGSFDELSGQVIPCEPVHIINGYNDDVICNREYWKKCMEVQVNNAVSEEN